jgi:hypothetical protein
MRRVLAILLALALASTAWAHTSSTGFLVVRVQDQHLDGSVELAVRDAERAVGIDTNGDGRITWGELRARAPALIDYVARDLGLRSGSRPCPLAFGELEVNTRVDGNYAWLPFTGRCALPVRTLTIDYRLLASVDPSHRGLLTLVAGSSTQTAVLGGGGAVATLAVGHPDGWRTFREYLQAGVGHILSGVDHLLFLLSLLLPAVLLRREGEWRPVPAARPALLGVLQVVTAFTLAHSITLSLAALDVVRLPSRLTESVIAASIVVAALNNVFPLVLESRARIAFGFGLLHGFGFASVLADMGLPAGARLLSLLSFNLGIEVGQIAVVLGVMPLVYRARSATIYRQAVLPWASTAIATIGLAWLIQRSFLGAP